MAHITADYVEQEHTGFTGTGEYTDSGAAAPGATRRTLSTVMATGDTCYYVAIGRDSSGNDAEGIEIGIGTKTATGLSRSVLKSTNGDAAINWSTSAKVAVMITAPSFVLADRFIRQDSSYTLTSQTAAQKVFNSSTNGAVTLPVGTYSFEALIAMTSMSATSGNATFDLGGTATLGTVLWHGFGRDVAADGATGTLAGSWSTDATLVAAPLVTGGTATAAIFKLEGTFEVTAAGTVILRVLLQTAAAAVVAAGSFLRIRYLGNTSVAAAGEWS